MNRTGGTFNFWKMLNFEKRLHLRKKRQGVLGAPFLLVGVFFFSFNRHMERIKPHLRSIKVASGIFLVSLGILIFTGGLAPLSGDLAHMV